MLAKSLRAPAWTKGGYLCTACRRQWLQSHAYPARRQVQARWSSGGGNDSWFESLNDITDSYSDFEPPKPDKPAKSESKNAVSAGHQARSKPEADEDGGLAGMLDTLLPQGPTNSQQGLSAEGSSSLELLRGQLHRSLSSTDRVKAAHRPPHESPAVTAKKSGSSLTQHRRDAVTTEHVFPSSYGLREAVDKRSPETADDTDSIVHDAYEKRSDGSIQPRKHFVEELIGTLQRRTNTLSQQQDRNIKKQDGREEDDGTVLERVPDLPVPLPFPKFRLHNQGYVSLNPVEKVVVLAGEVKEHRSAENIGANSRVWKAKTSPSANGLGGGKSHADTSPGPGKASSNRVNRAKWGGLDHSKGSEGRASFDSLEQADQVSVKRPISTAINKAPYGLSVRYGGNVGHARSEVNKESVPESSASPKPSGSGEVSLVDVNAALQGRPLERIISDPSIIPTVDGLTDHGCAFTVQGTLGTLYTALCRGKISMDLTCRTILLQEIVKYGKFLLAEVGMKNTGVPAPWGTMGKEKALLRVLQCSIALGDEKNIRSWIAQHVADADVSRVRQSITANLDSRKPGVTADLRSVNWGPEVEDMWRKVLELLPAPVTTSAKASAETARAPTINVTTPKDDQMSRIQAGSTDALGPAAPAGISIADAMRGGAGSQSRDDGDGKSGSPSGRDTAVTSKQQPEQAQTHPDPLHNEVVLSELQVQPLQIPQPPVPYLEYGLDRVLFNPGVYHLQDPASRVYNFDPYLQKIMPVTEFDFNSLKEYKTSSQDAALAGIARQHNKKFIGSTSSMTSSLAHFHYLISNWRPLNLDMLSSGYVGKDTSTKFTKINKAPSAIFLRWKNGTYAIDADKEFDSGNVLMLLGKSMELFLTSPKDEYEKYRKSDPRTVSEEQRTGPEAYQYSTMGDFLMRSQLDAYDPRLPDNGTFDLKTRAVVSVRMQAHDPEDMTGYEIFANQGRWASYEKEYHDMMRATMLKYMLQARMGCMNGIFVAYHNIKRIFGFQYIPIHEMDRALHGQSDTCLGDQEFKASLKIFNELLVQATEKFPEQSLRIHFETQDTSAKQKSASASDSTTALHMWAEPMTEDQIDEIQSKPKAKIAKFERDIMGIEGTDEASTNSNGEAVIDDLDTTKTEDSERDTFVKTENETDAAATKSTANDFGSTETPADIPFIKSSENSIVQEELPPLFFATTIVQSTVNDDVPDDERPTNLKKSDVWRLEYLIQEYSITRERWAQYEDMKARRKAQLCFEREDEDDIDEGLKVAHKSGDQFIQFLKNLSREGSKVRERMDELDAAREVVRADTPLPKHREKIEALEDYMRWMYEKEMED